MSDAFAIRTFAIAFSTLAFCCNAAYGDDAHYFPVVSGPAAGTLTGRLVDIGFGNAAGGLTIETVSGKVIDVYAASPPFVVDGSAVDCPIAPRRGFKPTRDECPHWPRGLVVGRSRISVPFWRGARYGKRTLIAKGFRTLGP